MSGFGFSYQQLSSSRKNVSIIVSVLAVSSLRAYSIQVFIHTVFCSFNPYLPRRMTFTYSASSHSWLANKLFSLLFFFRLVCGVWIAAGFEVRLGQLHAVRPSWSWIEVFEMTVSLTVSNVCDDEALIIDSARWCKIFEGVYVKPELTLVKLHKFCTDVWLSSS